MPRRPPPYVPHVLQALGHLNEAKGSKIETIVEQVRRKTTAENGKELQHRQNEEVTKAIMFCVKCGILIKYADRILFNLEVVRGRSGRKENTNTDTDDDSRKVSSKSAAKTNGHNSSSDDTSKSSSSKDTSVKRTRTTTVRRAQTRKRQRRSPPRPFRASNLFDSSGSLCSVCARDYILQPKTRTPQKRNATIARRRTCRKPPAAKVTPRVGRGRPKRGQPEPTSIHSSNKNNKDDEGDVGQINGGIANDGGLKLNFSEAADSNVRAVNEVSCGTPNCLCSLEQDDGINKN